MDRLISCEFNMDTACVELKFADGSMIAIDTIAVENELCGRKWKLSVYTRIWVISQSRLFMKRMQELAQLFKRVITGITT